jgi:hypothetical protein
MSFLWPKAGRAYLFFGRMSWQNRSDVQANNQSKVQLVDVSV